MGTHSDNARKSIYNDDDKCPLPSGFIVSGRVTGRVHAGKGTYYADNIMRAPIGFADSDMSKSPVRPPPPRSCPPLRLVAKPFSDVN